MILLMILATWFGPILGPGAVQEGEVFDLPEPFTDGEVSVEAALGDRHSVREFAPGPIALAQLGQLLWAAQGVNRPTGRRTAPSAGALYPLELFVLVGDVSDLPVGLYRYRSATHDLVTLSGDDLREELVAAALNQDWMLQASAVLVFGAVIERTAVKYGDRAPRYVHMEVGHAAQNIYLQAASLGLATTFAGAFNDGRVSAVLGLEDEEPLGIMPVGWP